MSANLNKLRELTERMATTYGECGDNYRRFEFDGGHTEAFGLHKEPGIAIARCRVPADTTFPAHTHGEVEILIVYSGEIAVSVNGRDSTLRVGDTITIYPDEPHTVSAEHEAWVIAITVPASRAFPHGG